MFAKALRNYPFTLYIHCTPACLGMIVGGSVQTAGRWVGNCREETRVLFKDDGICVRTESQELAGLLSDFDGIFEEGLCTMMNGFQAIADGNTFWDEKWESY